MEQHWKVSAPKQHTSKSTPWAKLRNNDTPVEIAEYHSTLWSPFPSVELIGGPCHFAVVTDALQEQFDDAMFDFSQGRADEAIAKLKNILSANPDFFDAQLALGGAYYAKGDYAAAIAEGHKAEKMRPNDQLVHTNLSRAYMKSGDKQKAEHYALQSRIASWRGDMSAPAPKTEEEKELEMAKPAAPPVKPPPTKFPDMPWKKNKPIQ